MAIYDYPRIRYNTVAGVLEMNIGFEEWVTIPLGIVPGEIVLADGKLLIGNSSGIAAANTLSGDATITNAGVVTVANVLRLTGGTITPASNGLTTLLVTRADGTTKVLEVLIGTSDVDTGALLTVSKTDGSGNTVRARCQNQSSNGQSEWQTYNDNGGFMSLGIGGSALGNAFANQAYVWGNNNGVMFLATGSAQQMLFNFNAVASSGTKAIMSSTGALAVGTNTNAASAQLQADSTTKGFLPPRMTTTERDAISSPAEGLVIYNLTTHVLNFYDGSAWGAV